MGKAHINLGETAYRAGNLVDAESHFQAAMAAFDAFGDRIRSANSLQGLAAVEALTGRPE